MASDRYHCGEMPRAGSFGSSSLLLERAKQEERAAVVRSEELTRAIRALEAEVENIKQAVAMGKATRVLMERPEERDTHLQALRRGREIPTHDELQTRVERVLAELPGRVQTYLEDLEKLLAQDQVERGKDILASLGTEVLISPDSTAEIRGHLRKALTLVRGQRDRGVVLWLGEDIVYRQFNIDCRRSHGVSKSYLPSNFLHCATASEGLATICAQNSRSARRRKGEIRGAVDHRAMCPFPSRGKSVATRDFGQTRMTPSGGSQR